jgi:hypothetical protein
MTSTQPETVIAMHADLRPEVLAGDRRTAWRPGHRGYAVGPATIRFLLTAESAGSATWTDDEPVDVMLTKVEHAKAKGRYQVYQRFLVSQGQAPDDEDKITLLEWVLV